MDIMKTRIIRMVALIAIVIAGLLGTTLTPASAAPPAHPAIAYNGATDCSQSAFLGARVCVDQTTGYGPIVYIYTSGTAVYGAWSIGYAPAAGGTFTPFVATPLEYVGGRINGYNPNGAIQYVTNAVCSGGCPNLLITSNQGVTDLLNWFSADANYEFVVTG